MNNLFEYVKATFAKKGQEDITTTTTTTQATPSAWKAVEPGRQHYSRQQFPLLPVMILMYLLFKMTTSLKILP